MDIWCLLLLAFTGITLLSVCFFCINIWHEFVPLIRLLMAFRVHVNTLAYVAVTVNRRNVLLYLRPHFSHHPVFTYTAALHDNIECLRQMHELGYVWHELTCAVAFVNGHVHCLHYAHQHGAALNLDKADQVQNAECMLYLILHGATFTDKALVNASERKDVRMFDLLLSTWGYAVSFQKLCIIAELGFHEAIDRPCQQYPDQEEMKTALQIAANCGHIEFLRVLHEKRHWPLPSSSKIHFQSSVAARTRDQIMSYLQTHTYVESECIECGMTALVHVPLQYKEVQQHPRWRKYARAGRKILDAMERAYLDPRYKWCRRGLMRDYHELMSITIKDHTATV